MLTPAACEEELRRLSKKLEEKTDALGDLLQEAATAEVDHKLAYAKAYLTVEGTVGERDADATLNTERELRDRKVAEAVAQACLESVRSIRDQLSAVQSANANVRFQAGLG